MRGTLLLLLASYISGHSIESVESTAGVIIALPNAFFDSLTGQLIDAMESKMNKDGFSLGTLRSNTFDLKFTKATLEISENKLSGMHVNRNNTSLSFYQEPT